MCVCVCHVHVHILQYVLSWLAAMRLCVCKIVVVLYYSGTECSSDQKSSKIVPIAVGAALAGLVVVVLIAYLIGRFRSRKQNSYEALS